MLHMSPLHHTVMCHMPSNGIRHAVQCTSTCREHVAWCYHSWGLCGVAPTIPDGVVAQQPSRPCCYQQRGRHHAYASLTQCCSMQVIQVTPCTHIHTCVCVAGSLCGGVCRWHLPQLRTLCVWVFGVALRAWCLLCRSLEGLTEMDMLCISTPTVCMHTS